MGDTSTCLINSDRKRNLESRKMGSRKRILEREEGSGRKAGGQGLLNEISLVKYLRRFYNIYLLIPGQGSYTTLSRYPISRSFRTPKIIHETNKTGEHTNGLERRGELRSKVVCASRNQPQLVPMHLLYKFWLLVRVGLAQYTVGILPDILYV